MSRKEQRKAVILTAPSGSGKTTIAREILKRFRDLRFSVSSTTRGKRKEEKDGRDYFFISEDKFRESIKKKEFLEWEEVYKGVLYGTLKKNVNDIFARGYHVLFDVDVKGGLSIKNILKKRAFAIFIMPPSLKVLEQRLKKRKSENKHDLKNRILKAREELAYTHLFDAVVLNKNLNDATQNTHCLIKYFLRKK